MKTHKLFLILLTIVCLIGIDVNAQTSREFIRNKIASWGECKNVAITKHNGDLALYGRNGWAGTGLPSGLSKALNELNEKNELIDDVQITENGNWLVLYGDNGFRWSGIPESLEEELYEYNNRKDVVTSVTFNDGGDWIIISREYFTASEGWISDWLKDGMDNHGALWAACVTSDAIVACYENGYKFYGNVPETLKKALKQEKNDVYRIKIAGTAWFYSDSEGHYNYSM